jgi:hypothetical protein
MMEVSKFMELNKCFFLIIILKSVFNDLKKLMGLIKLGCDVSNGITQG